MSRVYAEANIWSPLRPSNQVSWFDEASNYLYNPSMGLMLIIAFCGAYWLWKRNSITKEEKRGFLLFVLSFLTGLIFWLVVLVVSIGTVAEMLDWSPRAMLIPLYILIHATMFVAVSAAAVCVVPTANFLKKLASGEVKSKIVDKFQQGFLFYSSLSSLNKQKKILLAGAIAIIIALLFPPAGRRGFDFIFMTKLRYIDSTFLLVEILIIISIVIFAILYLKADDAQKSEEREDS